MTRARIAAVLAGLVAAAALILFALYNQGQPIVLRFGFWTWRGEAVYAVYGGIFLGLVTMFLVGLPGDLAVRRHRTRLDRRVSRDAAAQADEPGALRRKAVS